MHRTLSRMRRRALWMLATCSLTLTGCKTDKEAAVSDVAPQAALAPASTPTLSSTPALPSSIPADPNQAAAQGQTKSGEMQGIDEGGPGQSAAVAAKPAEKSSSSQPVSPSGAAMGRRGHVAGLATRDDLLASGAIEQGNTEDYRDYGTNPMVATAEDALSTFAVDVDTASYVIARRKLASGTLPPPASVRVEEFVNYFHYDYASPTDGRPFSVHMDAAPSPFTPGRHILRVGVQAKKLSLRERMPAHLVFLVDVSGSMQSPDKLDLAKRALRILVDNLKDGDTVSLVTYAGSTRVVLEPTGLERKELILSAIEELSAGGSTAMGSGIQLAYDMAAKNLASGSISRVIVLSDGDANVGTTSHQGILDTIRGHVKEGVTLSTIGFGMGNYKDTLMEQLANQGNGNYYYIDGISQARRVFQEQLGGTLEVVAKDVKIQVELDPAAVVRYRLVGYENRDIADIDFRNDRVDAGEIGAGHTVTALYELELTGKASQLGTVRIRAKEPRGSTATEYAYPLSRDQVHAGFDQASADFRFATAVMATAEVLRRSPHAEGWKLAEIERMARAAMTVSDEQASTERRAFVEDMLGRVAALQGNLAAR